MPNEMNTKQSNGNGLPLGIAIVLSIMGLLIFMLGGMREQTRITNECVSANSTKIQEVSERYAAKNARLEAEIEFLREDLDKLEKR